MSPPSNPRPQKVTDMTNASIKPSKLRRILFILTLILSVGHAQQRLIAAETPASNPATGESKIVALVNADIITEYDVEAKTNFHAVNNTKPLTPELRRQIRPQIIQELIDETLQLQEIQARGVAVDDNSVLQSIAGIEKDNNMAAGGLLELLAKNKVPRESYIRYLKSQLGWSQVVQMRSPAVSPVSEADVDNEQQTLRNAFGKPESLIAEIVLLHSSPISQTDHLQQAQYLAKRLREGGDFAKLAEEFSESITSIDGGRIGWVHPKQLEPEIDKAISTLAVGETSDVIKTARGFSIIKILNRRVGMIADPNSRQVTLQRVLFKSTKGANSQSDVDQMNSRIEPLLRGKNSCEEFLAAALKAGAVNAGRESRKVSDLGNDEREAVSNLEELQVSRPIRGSLGVTLIMVCQWSGGEEMPSREQIRNSLSRQRFGRQGFKILRDLQSHAFIEIRSE